MVQLHNPNPDPIPNPNPDPNQVHTPSAGPSPAQRQDRAPSHGGLRSSASTSGMRGRSRIDPSLPPEVPPEVPPEEATFTLTHGTNTEEGIPDTRAYQQTYQYAAPPKRGSEEVSK